MHRVPLVTVIAACIVIGHVVPHLLAPHDPLQRAPLVAPPQASHAPLEAAPLLPPTCRLQPPLADADREPMLAALRQLIARDEQGYPRLTARHALVRCGG
ncbi:MAG TPA: hypothetical protein VN903_08105 [Polyangia bacterium]|nr:hypothetical protein [Polyangia bacterium]